jgi:hypothetical protein
LPERNTQEILHELYGDSVPAPQAEAALAPSPVKGSPAALSELSEFGDAVVSFSVAASAGVPLDAGTSSQAVCKGGKGGATSSQVVVSQTHGRAAGEGQHHATVTSGEAGDTQVTPQQHSTADDSTVCDLYLGPTLTVCAPHQVSQLPPKFAPHTQPSQNAATIGQEGEPLSNQSNQASMVLETPLEDCNPAKASEEEVLRESPEPVAVAETELVK